MRRHLLVARLSGISRSHRYRQAAAADAVDIAQQHRQRRKTDEKMTAQQAHDQQMLSFSRSTVNG